MSALRPAQDWTSAARFEPLLLALDLESRGFSMTRQDGDVLEVQPYVRLSRSDCAAIRRWKWHLLSIVDHVPEVVQ